MSKVDVSQTICQAIDIIVDQKLANANFNKTILAKIIGIEDANTNKYKVLYQDSLTTATALNSLIIYKEGLLVKILVPSNDWTGIKFILGSLSISDNATLKNPLDYNLIGENVIYGGTELNIFNLSSYRPGGHLINIFSSDDVGADDLNNKIKRYIKQDANGILLSAYVRTNFDDDQTPGIYGVKFNAVFENEKGEFTKTFTLDVRDVLGNPYELNRTTLITHQILDLDIKYFKKILDITAYIKNFSPTDSARANEYNLLIANVGINAAQILSIDESKKINFYLNYPNGNYLNSYAQKVVLNGVLKRDGLQIVDGVEYKWYRQDASMNLGDKNTDLLAGAGWEILGTRDSNGNVTPFTDSDISFVYNTPTEDKQVQVEAAKTKVKCIAFYKGLKYLKEILIIYNNGVVITLDSEDKIGELNKSVYYLGTKNISYTCTINDTTSNGYYGFTWRVIASNLLDLTEGPIQGSVSNNTTSHTFTFTNLKSISEAEIICTIRRYNGNNSAFIGTVSQKIYNKYVALGSFSANIEGGNRLLQFNLNGEYAAEDEGQAFEPLSFVLTDPVGTLISHNIIQGEESGIIEWCWKVPYANTLIIPNMQEPYTVPNMSYIAVPADDEIYRYYANLDLYNYIISSFDSTAVNNTILLTIAYRNDRDLIELINTSTTFIPVKPGDPGTNGTLTIAYIRPVSNNGSDNFNSRRIYAQSILNLSNIVCNYVDNLDTFNNIKFFLQRNNTVLDINSNRNAISWQLPINGSVYSTQNGKQPFISHFKLDSILSGTQGDKKLIKADNIILPSTIQEINNYIVDIARATYTINDLIFYAEQPICYVYTISSDYRIKINEKSGFTYVVYNSSIDCSYDINNEFKVLLYHNVDNQWIKLDTITCLWSTFGGLEILGGLNNQTTVTIAPRAGFDLSDLRSSIMCKVSLNNNLIGFIHIPIYMLSNRYNHKLFNSWDGNSIQLDANGNSTIIAPLVVAGKKENDNSFTGVLIGLDRELGSNNNISSKVGLFAYGKGKQTVFIDANTGNAQFGSEETGKLEIVAEGNLAVIKSGDYPVNSNNTAAGMKIKFSSTNTDGDGDGPFIKFGTGNFSVDNEGNLTSKTGHIANWTINGSHLESRYEDSSPGSYVYINSDPQAHSATALNNLHLFLRAGTSNATQWSNTKFAVTHEGTLYAQNAQITGALQVNAGGKIGPWYVQSDKLYIDNTYQVGLGNKVFSAADINNSNAFGSGTVTNDVTARIWGQTGTSNTSVYFMLSNKGTLFAKNVTIKGTIKADAGYIGGWQIGTDTAKRLQSSNGKIWFNSDPTSYKSTLTGIANLHIALRVGTESSGSLTFAVTHEGTLYSNKAYIKGAIYATSGLFKGLLKGATGTFSGTVTANAGKIGCWSIATSADKSLTDGNVILGSNKTFSATNLHNRFGRQGTGTGKVELRMVAGSGTLTNINNVNFAVGADGVLYATGAYIKSAHIDAASITSGTIDSARIPSLSAGKITTGKLDASKVTISNLTVTSAQIKSLDVKKVTGTLKGGNITIDFKEGTISVGKLSASKISTGTVNGHSVKWYTQTVVANFSTTFFKVRDIDGNIKSIYGVDINSKKTVKIYYLGTAWSA